MRTAGLALRINLLCAHKALVRGASPWAWPPPVSSLIFRPSWPCLLFGAWSLSLLLQAVVEVVGLGVSVSRPDALAGQVSWALAPRLRRAACGTVSLWAAWTIAGWRGAECGPAVGEQILSPDPWREVGLLLLGCVSREHWHRRLVTGLRAPLRRPPGAWMKRVEKVRV